MRITKILLIMMVFVFVFTMSTFAEDVRIDWNDSPKKDAELPNCNCYYEQVPSANLPDCSDGKDQCYVNYFTYDYVRHTYMRITESMYNNLRSLTSSEDVGVAENVRYLELKKQFISNKSGKLLREDFDMAKIGSDEETEGEVYVYRYEKNRISYILRFVKRRKVDDDGNVSYLFYKIGYAKFNYLANGTYTVDYQYLQSKEVGDKKVYEYIFYLRDVYTMDDVLIGRQFNADRKLDDYAFIMNEDVKAREKWKVFSPIYNEEATTGVLPEEE